MGLSMLHMTGWTGKDVSSHALLLVSPFDALKGECEVYTQYSILIHKPEV